MTAVFGAATILLLPLLSPGIGRTAVAPRARGFWRSLPPWSSTRGCSSRSRCSPVSRSRSWLLLGACDAVDLRWPFAGGRRGRPCARDQRDVGYRAARRAHRLCDREVVVTFGIRCAARRRPDGGPRRHCDGGRSRRVVLFIISDRAAGRPESVPRRRAYLDRGMRSDSHVHPWHYYLRPAHVLSSGGLRWSEGVVLMLAIAGAARAWGPRFSGAVSRVSPALASPRLSSRRFRTRLRGIYCRSTPSLSCLRESASRPSSRNASRAVRGAIVAAFVVATGHLGWQAWRASVTYASDPRNPYVYAQTVPDAVRMAARIRELAALHADGSDMLVSVIASPHEQWPLPWYLRSMPHVGYWTAPGDALAPERAGRRRVDGSCRRSRTRSRRSLCRRSSTVLRPEVLTVALRRARTVGPLSCPRKRSLWHCGRRRARHDAP